MGTSLPAKDTTQPSAHQAGTVFEATALFSAFLASSASWALFFASSERLTRNGHAT
jgi:hypothetical protein